MLRRLMMAGTAGGGDPHWASVVSLLNFPGADGSTAITDARGKSWSVGGDAQIDTSLGYNALQLDGVVDYVFTSSHSDFNFTGDFCIDAWVRATLGADRGICSKRVAGANGWALEVRSTGAVWLRAKVGGSYSDTMITTATGLVSASTLAHVSLARSGSSWAIAVDGTVAGTMTNAGALEDYASDLYVGRSASNSDENPFSGHIRAIRFTNGSSRGYTSNFTPPTAPFPTS